MYELRPGHLTIRCITGLFYRDLGLFDGFSTNFGSKVGAQDWTTDNSISWIEFPAKYRTVKLLYCSRIDGCADHMNKNLIWSLKNTK